jgi:hypothetical protein
MATLTRYPEAVVRTVCSVDAGLPQTSKFLPSIAEVRAACESENYAMEVRRDRDENADARAAHEAEEQQLAFIREREEIAKARAAREAAEERERLLIAELRTILPGNLASEVVRFIGENLLCSSGVATLRVAGELAKTGKPEAAAKLMIARNWKDFSAERASLSLAFLENQNCEGSA